MRRLWFVFGTMLFVAGCDDPAPVNSCGWTENQCPVTFQCAYDSMHDQETCQPIEWYRAPGFDRFETPACTDAQMQEASQNEGFWYNSILFFAEDGQDVCWMTHRQVLMNGAFSWFPGARAISPTLWYLDLFDLPYWAYPEERDAVRGED